MSKTSTARDALTRKLSEHSDLKPEELHSIRLLDAQLFTFKTDDDIVRQGDKPSVSVVVLKGMVGRYHTLVNGKRQYLSFHITGDMPDAQSLFIGRMDHAVCAINNVCVAMIPHRELIAAFKRHPGLGFAIWRETLIDAAIFREAITNNSARSAPARLAHFFCEQHYRARAVGLGDTRSTSLPLSQTQLGETLGMSLVTVNRTLQRLRHTGCMDLKNGSLMIHNWDQLKVIGEFDESYLHLQHQVTAC